MAKEYDNNNSGVLFRNDRKENDRQPDYKGSAEINGVEVWISAWKKQSQNGTGFLSLSFKPKQGAPANDDMPDDFDI